VAASKGRHLVILLRSSSSSLLLQNPLSWACSDRTRRAGHGPATGARREQPIRLAIFCGQVFFEYDPSSATSLLSSAGISARECVWVSVCYSMQCCDVCEWRHRALYRSSPITPKSSCELLRPGVLWLRSFFGYQSSFFGRHLDQALPPHDCDSVCLCEQQFPEMVGNDAREVDEGKWKEFGGKVGKGKWAAMVSYVCCNLYWTYTRLSFFQYFSTSFDFADPGS